MNICPEYLCSVYLQSVDTLDATAQSGELTQLTENKFVETVQLTTTETTQPVEKDTNDQSSEYLHFFRDVDPLPDQHLRDILSRKYRIANFTWTSAQAVETIVYSAVMPKALLDTSQNLIEKINRFQYFRAGVEFEFQIAGTMYHKGLLMAAILPFVKNPQTDLKLESLGAMSTCEHIVISPSTNTTKTLSIPFRMFTTHWEHTLTSAEGYFGGLLVRVAVPLGQLNQQTTVSLSVAVFARFTNPEVMGPTLHAMAQSNDLKIPDQSGINGLNQVLDRVEKQTDKEANRKAKTGIVSKVLETASGVSSFLALTPIGGPIAAAVSAGLGILGNVARKWGYDKPNNITTYTPAYLSTVNMLANGNGMNTQYTLGVDTENAISRRPEDFGTFADETSISYLLTLPGMFVTGSFDSTDAAGTIITEWYNHPLLTWDPDPMNMELQLLPCSTLGMFFKYWRGSMKYHFRFVMNKFTVCKVRVSWGINQAESIINAEGEGDFPSTVFEIGGGDTDISFSVPYLSHYPYSVRHPFRGAMEAYMHAGYIRITIVNPTAALQANTDTSVNFIGWVSCGEDMDFQGPYPNELVESGYDGMLLYTEPANEDVLDATAQSRETCNIREIFKQEFPPLFVSRRSVMIKVNTGEHIRSLLTLLHRFMHVDTITATVSDTNFYDMPGPISSGNYKPILFNIMRYWFLYFRGSLSYKLIPDSNTTGLDCMLMVENSLTAPSSTPVVSAQRHGIQGVCLENLRYKPAIEFSVPFYSQYPYRWRPWTYPTQWRGILPHCRNGFTYHLHTYDTNLETLSLDVFMALSDDAQFGYPSGCPKLLLTSTLKTSKTEQKVKKAAPRLRSQEHFLDNNNNKHIKSSKQLID